MRARRIIILGSTLSGQAGTHTPLRMHTASQPSASGVPGSPRSTASTPGTTFLPSLAGAFEYLAIGQASKHLPHCVHAPRMRSTSRSWYSFSFAPMRALGSLLTGPPLWLLVARHRVLDDNIHRAQETLHRRALLAGKPAQQVLARRAEPLSQGLVAADDLRRTPHRLLVDRHLTR